MRVIYCRMLCFLPPVWWLQSIVLTVRGGSPVTIVDIVKVFRAFLVKPRLHDTAGCLTTGLTTVLNEQLFVQPVVKPGCTTGLPTGLSTGFIVWQQVVSCKRGLKQHAAFKWKDAISGFHVSPCSAEALVRWRWGEKIKHLFIADILSNTSVLSKSIHVCQSYSKTK